MKLLSIQYIFSQVAFTFSRFPFEIVCSIISAFAGIHLIHSHIHEDIIGKILMCSSLGVVCFLSLTIYSEVFLLKSLSRNISKVILLTFLIGYYFTFSDKSKEIEILRHVVLMISVHLLISFIGFIRQRSVTQFWDFNKMLFLRFLLGALYSGVLFLGLTVALVAIDNLFHAKIDGKVYGYLFVSISMVFNTLFFLAGFPVINKEMNNEVTYPKGLKTFTQFVLLPLVSIYLLILLSYEVKIVYTLNLPDGWVSNLILVFAVAGILSILLVYPIQNEEDNRWIKTFTSWFYLVLIPLIFLLFWAIEYRLQKYGFTQERYYVFVLAIWLSFITIYFLVSKVKNIKLIPISLFIVGLISTYGPLSASFISKRSQLNRFEKFAEANKANKISKIEQKEMSSVADYIINSYGINTLKERMTRFENQTQRIDTLTSCNEVMEFYGLNYYASYENFDNDQIEYIEYTAKGSFIQDVQGFDILMDITESESTADDSVIIRGNCIISSYKKSTDGFHIKINKEELIVSPLKKLKELHANYPDSSLLLEDRMMTFGKAQHFEAVINYGFMKGELTRNDSINVYVLKEYGGIVLIKIK